VQSGKQKSPEPSLPTSFVMYTIYWEGVRDQMDGKEFDKDWLSVLIARKRTRNGVD